MARILLDGIEIEVAQDTEDILNRIVNSRDGVRLASGAIVAPPGWVIVTERDTGDPTYVQVARIACVRED